MAAAGAKGAKGADPFGGVVRHGYLRKLKTMRKKYFVLRAETADASPRLEYHDSEKKFRLCQPPKRSIALKTCFNINRRSDVKHKNVVALYTKDDCFCVVFDTDDELQDWLETLLALQQGEVAADGEAPKPTFEHVWPVMVENRGLGSSRGILGPYHLCLTDKTLSLVRKTDANPGHQGDVKFSLMSIRCCGHTSCMFYLEVGRSSTTGAGDLWMKTEDQNIAENMHRVILHAMSNNNNNSKEEFAPKPRNRSSSANETSKPTCIQQRRQTHSGSQKPAFNQDGPQTADLQASQESCAASASKPWTTLINHQRTQSLPLSSLITATVQPAQIHGENNNPCCVTRGSVKRSNATFHSRNAVRERCDSMPSRARTASEGNPYSAPATRPHTFLRPQSLISNSPPASPASGPCSSDSAGSSFSIDEPDNCWGGGGGNDVQRYMHSVTPDEPIVEENCDDCVDSQSLQGRPQHHVQQAHHLHHHHHHHFHPHHHHHHLQQHSKRLNQSYVTHSSPSGSPYGDGYVPMAPQASDDGYVDMSPRGGYKVDMSPAASVSSVTSGTPSTDMRFQAYHMEKVYAYITPSEEEDGRSADRPIRAYSVGSRPERHKGTSKSHNETCFFGTTDSASGSSTSHVRTRAFSFGSKIKGPSRILPPHSHPPPASSKSSSAPLLGGSRTSVAPMGDLMELDFSKPQKKSGSRDDDGYVDMQPSAGDGAKDVSSSSDLFLEFPYVDMQPSPSPIKSSDYTDMSTSLSLSSPVLSKQLTPPTGGDAYVEMSRGSTSSAAKAQPHSHLHPHPYPHPHPHPHPKLHEEYMDMEFSSETKASLPISSNVTKVSSAESKSKHSDGYMDMTCGNAQPQLRMGSDVKRANSSEDYMNMSGSFSSRKKDRRNSGSSKAIRSMPIAIQPSSSSKSNLPNTMHTSASSRKHLAQQCSKAPPTYLPLSGSTTFSPVSSPSNSAPRRASPRKNSLRDSKENLGSGSPSSASVIFPFSPASPVRTFQQPSPPLCATSSSSTAAAVDASSQSSCRKCAVDASSGTVKLSAETAATPDDAYALMDYTSRIPALPQQQHHEQHYHQPLPQPQPQQQQADDYVNFCPAPAKSVGGDYAVMRMDKACCTASPLTDQLSSLSVSKPAIGAKACDFQPIMESRELNCSTSSSPRPGDTPPRKPDRDLEASRLGGGDYEVLRINADLSRSSPREEKAARRPGGGSLSRPSSVSSELGSSGSSTLVAASSRPASVNSDCILAPRPSSVSSDREMNYASLDLAPAEDDGSRSPLGASSTPNLTNAATTAAAPGFTYAEIDFVKSEGLKQQMVTNKH